MNVMKKRLLSLLLAVGCLSVALTPALAAPQVGTADPDLVLPYSEEEDPLADGNHLRSGLSGSDSEIFDKVFGAKISYVSSYTGKTYYVPSDCKVYDGIDVSKWEGTINWSRVMGDGVDFAFIRVGYRGTSSGALYEDPWYDQYMQQANDVGMPVGVYIYSQALNQEEAVAEAKFSLERVKNYNVQLPIVIDYEYYTGSGRLDTANLSRRQKTQNVLAFCNTVLDAGYQPMLYANKSFMTDDVYAEEISEVAPVWLAHYTTNTSYSGSYDYWQYSESGRVDGISTDVDCNFYFTDGPLIPENSVCGFKDVLSSKWYADAVSYVYNAGLMTGTSSTTFGPTESLTRPMMAQILYNFCGRPAVTYSKIYTDVPAGQWYTNAVIWAAKNKIMLGYGNGTFGVNNTISREQIATVLYNFSRQQKLDTSAQTSLSAYSDASKVSGYAVTAMQWAVASKVMSGRSANILAPQSTTTRAECAQLFKTYLTGPGASLMKS